MPHESNQVSGRPVRLMLLGVVVALVLAGAALWLIGTGGRDDGQQPDQTIGLLADHRPEVGQRAPDFALQSVREPDTIHRLSDFQGKAVVLNWYASWCGPCRAEIPDFQAAYSAHGDDLVILGVNLEESPEVALGLLDELGSEYPAVLDAEGSIAAHYRVVSMPTTYFIDADGLVVGVTRGLLTTEALAEQLATLGIDLLTETER